MNTIKAEVVQFTTPTGKVLPMTVTISAEIDTDFDIESDLEDDRDREQVLMGMFTPMVVQVKATWNGLEGSDILGGCLIGCQQDILDTVDDNGMINEAITELYKIMIDLKEKLKAI